MLRLEGVSSGYGAVQVLRGLSLEVAPGEILCLLGRNGAGKTTAMKTIMRQLPLSAGRMTLDGCDISALAPHQVAPNGIGYIPQGRRLFAELTVAQNIEIGLRARGAAKTGAGDERERVLALFPRLKERLNQRASTLSGGEQQMLATARALCIQPRVLLLDEPTEGLQPSMIAAIRDVVVQMRAEGVAILLVEQRVEAVLSVADRVAFIENGQIRDTTDAASLRADPAKLHRYLGV